MPAYQVVLLVVFAISTLHAAYKAISQSRAQRRLQERELRWKQAEQARLVLNELEDDDGAQAAMLSLDWDGRPQSLAGRRYVWRWPEVDEALRVVRTDKFTQKEMVIRDCYDRLFYQFERISQWIDAELISIYDVIFPLNYLVECMAPRRAVFEAYLTKYRYFGALALVARFEAWGGELHARSRPPPPPPRGRWAQVRDFLAIAEPLRDPDLGKILGPVEPGK